MSLRQYTIAQRPQNGCARCHWWKKHGRDNWGSCSAHRVHTWWQHGPCVEYEKDQDIPDGIRLIGVRDEIHNGD